METIKNYLTSLGITLGLILTFSFFMNIFNYYDLLNIKLYKSILLLLISISILIGSFILGKKTKKQGYIEGIKYGLITCIIMIIFSFLAFDNSLNISSFIYYLIITIVSVIGSILGINKKN